MSVKIRETDGSVTYPQNRPLMVRRSFCDRLSHLIRYLWRSLHFWRPSPFVLPQGADFARRFTDWTELQSKNGSRCIQAVDITKPNSDIDSNPSCRLVAESEEDSEIQYFKELRQVVANIVEDGSTRFVELHSEKLEAGVGHLFKVICEAPKTLRGAFEILSQLSDDSKSLRKALLSNENRGKLWESHCILIEKLLQTTSQSELMLELNATFKEEGDAELIDKAIEHLYEPKGFLEEQNLKVDAMYDVAVLVLMRMKLQKEIESFTNPETLGNPIAYLKKSLLEENLHRIADACLFKLGGIIENLQFPQVIDDPVMFFTENYLERVVAERQNETVTDEALNSCIKKSTMILLRALFPEGKGWGLTPLFDQLALPKEIFNLTDFIVEFGGLCVSDEAMKSFKDCSKMVFSSVKEVILDGVRIVVEDEMAKVVAESIEEYIDPDKIKDAIAGRVLPLISNLLVNMLVQKYMSSKDVDLAVYGAFKMHLSNPNISHICSSLYEKMNQGGMLENREVNITEFQLSVQDFVQGLCDELSEVHKKTPFNSAEDIKKHFESKVVTAPVGNSLEATGDSLEASLYVSLLSKILFDVGKFLRGDANTPSWTESLCRKLLANKFFSKSVSQVLNPYRSSHKYVIEELVERLKQKTDSTEKLDHLIGSIEAAFGNGEKPASVDVEIRRRNLNTEVKKTSTLAGLLISRYAESSDYASVASFLQRCTIGSQDALDNQVAGVINGLVSTLLSDKVRLKWLVLNTTAIMMGHIVGAQDRMLGLRQKEKMQVTMPQLLPIPQQVAESEQEAVEDEEVENTEEAAPFEAAEEKKSICIIS